SRFARDSTLLCSRRRTEAGHAMSRCHRIPLGLWACLALGACAHDQPKRGLTYAAHPAPPKVDLRRPVAKPAAEAVGWGGAAGGMAGSRVVVGLRRLGAVPFDSQTLPLTSPDGRWIATEHGATPSWGAV